jgi:hypothetical protein
MTGSITYLMCMPSMVRNVPCLASMMEVLAGALPFGKARLVQAWIEIHREELLANWQLAIDGEEVFKVEPLR